jgi:hypothetical protein
LLLRSFAALRSVDPGYVVENIFTFQMAPEQGSGATGPGDPSPDRRPPPGHHDPTQVGDGASGSMTITACQATGPDGPSSWSVCSALIRNDFRVEQHHRPDNWEAPIAQE